MERHQNATLALIGAHAQSSNGELSSKEIERIKNKEKILYGVLNFSTEEKLQKEWSSVNWEWGAADLASLVISSSNPAILKNCPLVWNDIAIGKDFLWLDTMIATNFHDLIEAYRSTPKSVAGKEKCIKVFWDDYFQKNEFEKICKEKIFSPERGLDGKCTLFESALSVFNELLISKFELKDVITDQETATRSLILLLNNNCYLPEDKSKKLKQKIINHCLSFSPNPKKVVLANYFSFDDNSVAKIKKLKLDQLMFTELSNGFEDYTNRLRSYFCDHIKSLSQSQQKTFLKDNVFSVAASDFPLEQTFFVKDFLSSLQPEVLLLFFERTVFPDLFDPGTSYDWLETFSKIDPQFSLNDLKSMVFSYTKTINQNRSDSGCFGFNKKTAPLFVKLFAKEAQNDVKKLIEDFQSFRPYAITEKWLLWSQLPSQPSTRLNPPRKM